MAYNSIGIVRITFCLRLNFLGHAGCFQRCEGVDSSPEKSHHGILTWHKSEAHQAAQEAAVDGVLPQWMQEEFGGYL